MGSALTIIPIAHMIKSSGYEHTFLTFGLFQALSWWWWAGLFWPRR
jgi:hypothetical protein